MSILSLTHNKNTLPPHSGAHGWSRWLLDIVLMILFLGPLLSPLFRATGQPVVDETGALARNMLIYICPTPAQSYMLLGFPMAVCARCWGATIGLWVARLWLPAAVAREDRVAVMLSWFRSSAWPLRLLLCVLPFLLWPLEIVGTAQGWWALPPLWMLVINGAQAGFAAGLFFCSLWPGFWPRQADSATSTAALRI
jgi:uncharacterized membrane protein